MIGRRIAGFKLGFSEEDIRLGQEGKVVYLDATKRYPVPDIARRFKRGFHWQRTHKELELLTANSVRNNTGMSGGLIPKLKGVDGIVIFGSGTRRFCLPKPPPKWITIGVGSALAQPQDLDYYIGNHPDSDCMAWQALKSKKWPKGIFSYATFPDFIRSFKGLKFFYGSGWEIQQAPLYLVDLMDPLSTALSLIPYTESKTIVLANCILSYSESKPGMVEIDGAFMYPQQIISLSMLSALIFWLSRSGRDIYTLDEGLGFSPPNSIVDLFKEV